MAGTKLTWVRYQMSLPATSPLRALTIGQPGLPDGTSDMVMFELPNLAKFPSPLQKIELLLDKAAEVEHALLVQYLYSAYSLKSSASVTDAKQKADLDSWQGTIREIAKEEMGHLMSVQNLRLVLGLPPSYIRDDFPMVQGLFPFGMNLHRLDQTTLAEYVLAESPVNAEGIADIAKLAMGSGGMVVNHVAVLYGLIAVLLARNLAEIEADAASGAFYDRFVRDLAYLAYLQDPPSDGWHLPDGTFDATSVPRQGTQQDWAPGNADIRIHIMSNRQDAKGAIKDIGVQGEGPGQGPDMTSHFARFLAIYRGMGAIRPFPADGDWVPTIDVPTQPKVSDDAGDPGAISNPTTQPWAKLANLRYAILLGFLEEYLLSGPVAGRDFLSKAALYEMTVNLRRLSVKLVGMPRSVGGVGVAALPFELPRTGFPLAADDDARKKVHASRLADAIALESQILASEGGTDPLLTTMQAKDKQTLLQFAPPETATEEPSATPTGAPAMATTTTHWPQVKQILDGLIADWITANGSPPDLTGKHSDPSFGWATANQLADSKPKGYQLIVPGVAGKDTNLVRALRDSTGVDGNGQMPYGGPYLTDPDPKYKGQLDYIIKWIDEGMPA